MSKRQIFKPITVSPDDLILDPNNPRLVQDLRQSSKISDRDAMNSKTQRAIENRFSERSDSKKKSQSEDFTNIKDLYDSMKRVGYVGIDRIVVREIEGSSKYLVLEGNRRTCTIKRLLKNAENFTGSDLVEFDEVKHTFEKIDALLIQTKGLSEEEVQDQIAIILGLRHFGSVKDWNAINRAFNTYENYMATEPIQKEFIADRKRREAVSAQLSISVGKVESALKTYIVYRQLTEDNSAVEEDHYSLIESGIKLTRYDNFFTQDKSTYEFCDESLGKLESLCQFSERKALTGTSKLIVSEPSQFNRLGKLLKHSLDHKNEAIRVRAKQLVDLVQEGAVDEDGNLEMTVDQANSLLTTEMNRKEWVAAVKELLELQNEKLPLEGYDGEGAHLKAKENLEESIVHLRKIFGV